MLSQPLLQKRCSAQKNKLVLARSSSYHQPPPLHYSPLKPSLDVSQSRPGPDLITKRFQGLEISKMKSTNPIFPAPGKVKEYRRSLSVDLKPHRSCGKQHPFVMDSDLQIKLSESRGDHIQTSLMKVCVCVCVCVCVLQGCSKQIFQPCMYLPGALFLHELFSTARCT